MDLNNRKMTNHPPSPVSIVSLIADSVLHCTIAGANYNKVNKSNKISVEYIYIIYNFSK